MGIEDTTSSKINAIKHCPFDLKDFYTDNKGLVKKYIRKNTYSMVVDDWVDVPKDWNYNGNSNIIRSGIKDRNFSTLQKLEWIKCALDVVYFTKRHIKIISIDDGIIPFNLYNYQESLLDQYQNNRFVIAMQCRQSGKSQTTAAYILWYGLFNQAKKAAVLANKASQAQEILSRVQLSFESLPHFMQMGVKSYNKQSMEFENESKIFSAASSSSSIRGQSISLLYIDECAFIPNDMQFYESTYPVIASGKESQVIITSTPNGERGLFYKLWQECVASKNDFVSTLVTWDQVPGRDEEWKRQTIANTSIEQFRQEHECVFRGSANTLLSAETLDKLVTIEPLLEEGDVLIYKEPVKDHVYTTVVDTSRGVGRDYHFFSVFDCTTKPFEIVATFRNNKMSPLIYPSIVMNVSENYNEAYVLVEINDIGEQVANILYHDLEYENILTTIIDKTRQTIGYGSAQKLGVRTTTAVKAVGCANAKSLIEKDQIVLNDYNINTEFGTFIPKGKSYEADDGCHDDGVMTVVLFAWATTQQFFKDLTDSDVRQSVLSQYQEESGMPFGIIDDNFGGFDGNVGFDDNPREFGEFGTF